MIIDNSSSSSNRKQIFADLEAEGNNRTCDDQETALAQRPKKVAVHAIEIQSANSETTPCAVIICDSDSATICESKTGPVN
jgi:hypothetical protein